MLTGCSGGSEDEAGSITAVVCPDSAGERLRFLFSDPDERAAWIAAVDRLIGTRLGAAARQGASPI